MFCPKLMISREFAIMAVLLVLAAGTTARAQTFSVVYNFGTTSTDPAEPDNPGILAQGRDGNLYGTTPTGGVNGFGAVFQLTPVGTLVVKYSFAGLSDGTTPHGGLTLGTDGNFYGTTSAGGTTGYGTVFKVTPGGALTTLYTFNNGNDGSVAYAPPVQGTDGNFYGTTSEFPNGCGTIYKITPTGALTSLYQFDNTHGCTPYSPLLLGIDGNFYGTTANGGSSGNGVVFKITPAGKLSVLHNFDGTHGRVPSAPLVQGNDGNFYGAAAFGGPADAGVLFKLTPTGGGFTVLHSMNGTTEGSETYGFGLAANGNLYGVNTATGTATTGCQSGCGTLFEITPTLVFSVLHNFDGPTGINPSSSPVQFTSGLVYGEARFGGTGTLGGCAGTAACGTAFSWSEPGLTPFVRTLTNSGKVGKTVEVLGQGFTGATAVSFNGKPATFTVASATYLTATIPAGATTGLVRVVTPGGTLSSNQKFRVTPQITSFTPPSGPVTTAVTITGVSLTGATKVSFGGVAATTFTVNSDTQVTATVPTGAKTGKIAITTPGGTASSATNFTVTP
jgi:uncharacterized repeat protein (TIGR03803 family)